MTTDLKSFFLLDPEVIFLNHGSFGACPRPVFEAYQSWQRRLEAQPVEFLGRQAPGLLAEARAALAAYLGVAADEVVYFPNPTTAINMVVRNFQLQPGDEILASDQEYGSLDRTWRYYCRRAGANYINRPVRLPVTSAADFIADFWAGVTPRTRAIFLSHITSPTALIFPLAEICARARQAGILTIIDGAHAPGQIPLDLPAIGADFYTGACHKWLCAPKGAAFLYARREVQSWLDPLVISWGYESEKPGPSRFIDYHEMQGTRDLAAFLSVPVAIAFQQEHDWPAVRQRCHALAAATRSRLNALTGLPAIAPEDWFSQMFTAYLPEGLDLPVLHDRLAAAKIEVPAGHWLARNFIRVSIQAYNTSADAETLIQVLADSF